MDLFEWRFMQRTARYSKGVAPRCHGAVKQGMEAFKALFFCRYVSCFLDDRLLKTETGKTKVAGSGGDVKADRGEPRTLPHVSVLNCLMKVHAGTTLSDSKSDVPKLLRPEFCGGFQISKVLPVGDECFILM